MKQSVISIDHFIGLVNLCVLWMKGHILRLLHVQLKVPGDSSDFSVPLTKTSLMFLVYLNEMSGGSEKILPVLLSF